MYVLKYGFNLNSDWQHVLQEELKQPYFDKLMVFISEAYQKNTCFPKKECVFEAFNNCLLSEIKVVILGQDPYHGEGQANGYCFSVPDGMVFPPSLVNIFKELEADQKKTIPISGNLEYWAKQGVFLLNAVLTVEKSKAGSHQKQGWERFTDAVIRKISESNNHVVFMLWGNWAQKKAKFIDQNKHLVLCSGHPSPLSANRGHWFGNRHFGKANAYLKEKGKKPIEW